MNFAPNVRGFGSRPPSFGSFDPQVRGGFSGFQADPRVQTVGLGAIRNFDPTGAGVLANTQDLAAAATKLGMDPAAFTQFVLDSRKSSSPTLQQQAASAGATGVINGQAFNANSPALNAQTSTLAPTGFAAVLAQFKANPILAVAALAVVGGGAWLVLGKKKSKSRR